MTAPATGQIWRNNETGRRIKLRLVNEWEDWTYVTLPDNPTQRSRTGVIFEYNLVRRYHLESA